mgnify:CR=1 FL=1
MKISILTSKNHPFFGYFLSKIEKKIQIDSVIIDEKKFSQKDMNLWFERTSNRIQTLEINDKGDIKFFFVKNHNDEQTLKIVEKRQIDLLINFGTPRILKGPIIKSPSLGILNCHPGILPYYRGCTCVEWALYNNDPVGNTCHLMTEEIDSGPVINKNQIEISANDSYQDIRIKVYLDSVESITRSVRKLKENKTNNFFPETGGKYYKPISNEKLNEVFLKYKNENRN